MPSNLPAGATIDSTPTQLPAGASIDAQPSQLPAGANIDSTPTTQPHWYDAAAHELGELNTGFTTALSQTGLTAQRAIGAIPGVGPAFQRATATARAADIARASQPMNTPGRMAGNAIENIIEFASGDELLKGASTLAKVEKLAPLASTLRKLPPRLLQVMESGIRQGGVGTAQSLLHGNPLTTAIGTGAAGAVGGAALEGVLAGAGNIISKIAPSSTEALGETLPTLASQKPGASPLSEAVADIRSEPQTAAAIQQGAQKGIVNRAQRTAYNELEKLNQARQARWMAGEREINLAPEAEAAQVPPERQLGTGQAQLPEATATTAPQLPEATATTAPQLEAGAPPAPATGLARTNEVGQYEGAFPEGQPGAAPAPTAQQPTPPTGGNRVPYIEEQPPNFQPIDSTAEVQNIRSFKDAANKIRQHAAPIFQRFNTATGGEYVRLRGLLDDAYHNEDYAQVPKLEDQIDGLFDQTRGKVDRTDFQAAKSAWRSSKVLDAVHSAVSRSFNISDESLAADANAWRGINGGKLMNGINRLTERYGRKPIENIIGEDGLTGLTKIATLTQTPQRAAMYGQVVGDVTNHMTGMMTKPGIIGSTVNEVRKLVLHSAATNPRVARMIEYAAMNRVAPQLAAPLIAATINGQVSSGNQPPPQDTEVVPANPQRGIQSVTLPTQQPPGAP
jgi:hypothetical protein